MVLEFKEWIVDKYLTWRTGYNKEQRKYREWYYTHVVVRATEIDNMFGRFKHVLIVDPDKFFDYAEPFGWVPVEQARSYFWPNRPIETTCVWRFERAMRCPSTGNRWAINELGGTDTVFVACNSDEDALMISLLYA